MVELDPTEELNRAVEKVLASGSTKRLIIAGPGAGKTFLFKRILERTVGDEHSRITLTFINELKADLEKSLSGLAQLRSSSQEFIRNLRLGGEYEVFELPFCMRCPEPVIRAVNSILIEVENGVS
jgi:hypothetical protein